MNKRQTLDQERCTRIFDPKMRTLGVDKDAIDRQMEERSRIRQLEKDREEFFNSQAVLMDQHAVWLEEQSEASKAQNSKDVAQYSKQFQKKEAGRDWDLNDPNALKKEFPGRLGDNDPRTGVSSMQQFSGEDLGLLERKQAQATQTRKWVSQQVDQKRLRQFLESEQDRLHLERQEELAERAEAIDQQVKAQRQAEAQATAAFNAQLAKQKRQEDLRNKRQETLDNYEEIRNCLESDMLSENPASTLNANDPYRFKPYHMKGLTPEHRQAILNEQATQRDELEKRKEREAAEEMEWAVAAAKVNAMGQHVEEERKQQRRFGLQKLANEWQQQAADVDSRKAQDTATLRNGVGEQFFSRFNSASR